MADRIEETAEDRRPGIVDMEATCAAAAPDPVGDDFGNDGNGIEPAMVVLPSAGPQTMPVLASAGLPPVHPEKTARRLNEELRHLVERREGNRSRIQDAASQASHAPPELRQGDAGSSPFPSASDLLGSDAADLAPEGSAWLILPARDGGRSLGNEVQGHIRIALVPRIADAILGMLAEALKSSGSGALDCRFASLGDPVRLDSPIPGSSPRMRAAPDRIASRPRPDQWCDEELLTLPEAARLFWPDGPLTTTSLRTAAREGTLEIRTVAGRHMTTPAALRRLGLPRSEGAAPGPSVSDAAASMLGRLDRRR